MGHPAAYSFQLSAISFQFLSEADYFKFHKNLTNPNPSEADHSKSNAMGAMGGFAGCELVPAFHRGMNLGGFDAALAEGGGSSAVRQ